MDFQKNIYTVTNLHTSGHTCHMPRKVKVEDKRMKISGTIPRAQHEWLEKMIAEGKFYNKSHALQEGLKALREKEAQSS